MKMPLALTQKDNAVKPSSTILTVKVMEALASFVPGDKYLSQNARTELGVEMEAECILNSSCVSSPLDDYKNQTNLPANLFR